MGRARWLIPAVWAAAVPLLIVDGLYVAALGASVVAVGEVLACIVWGSA